MTDRDRETLAARADFATTQKELAKLQLEHRAVLAELYDRPGSRQDWIDRCYGVEARIDAALALLAEAKDTTEQRWRIVKALKGGK